MPQFSRSCKSICRAELLKNHVDIDLFYKSIKRYQTTLKSLRPFLSGEKELRNELEINNLALFLAIAKEMRSDPE